MCTGDQLFQPDIVLRVPHTDYQGEQQESRFGVHLFMVEGRTLFFENALAFKAQQHAGEQGLPELMVDSRPEVVEGVLCWLYTGESTGFVAVLHDPTAWLEWARHEASSFGCTSSKGLMIYGVHVVHHCCIAPMCTPAMTQHAACEACAMPVLVWQPNKHLRENVPCKSPSAYYSCLASLFFPAFTHR